MATVQLADIVEPTVFTAYMLQLSKELSAFRQSGVITQTEEFDTLAMAGGSLIHMPFWNEQASDDPNIGTDNPATTSTPKKIGADEQVAIKHRHNQSWSAADLAGIVAGSDPLRAIASRVANYWSRVQQKYLVSTLMGLLADNVANDSSDMLHTIATDPVTLTDAERISAAAIVSAWATLGDASSDVTAIGMHSVPYHHLQGKDLITFQPTSGQDVGFGTYLGKTVIVDDGFTAVAQTNQTKYTSVLFGGNSVAYGEGAPKVPTEVEREASQGNGEGVENLHSRRHYVMHPRGFAWLSGSMASTSPTRAEAAAAANWNRVYERKAIPLAFLETNG